MNIKNMLLGGLLGVSGLYSMVSQATCTFQSGSAGDSEVISFGNVIVQRDAPVGTIVATTTASTFSNRGAFIRCTTPGVSFTTNWTAENTSPINFNGEQLFNVGISGLAMRVITPGAPPRSLGQYGSGTFSRIYSNTRGCLANVPYTYSDFCGNNWGPVTFELVKITNTTGSGTLTVPGRIRSGIVNETYVYSYSFGASTVSTVACSVTNTSINVPMGNVQRSNFSGVGYESNPIQFFIPLDCDAATRVNFKIDATADNSGVPGVMSIDSSATGNAASGVGIKLTRSGAPVAFGTVIPVGTVASAGMFSIPLIAQYYQTNSTVTAGQANGTATFTMTYN